jgi:hypothetical protein
MLARVHHSIIDNYVGMLQDLSAFAMPLLESDLQDGGMDVDVPEGRPRSSSGSQGGLKQFFGSKARQRNKSGERELDSSKGGTNGSSGAGGGGGKDDSKSSSKVKSFFDTFRPRSKSDVSGLKKPGKKHRDGVTALGMDRSMDESSLGGPGSVIPGFKPGMAGDPHSPMSQILENQMLGVPGAEGERVRHKSTGMVGYANFMSTFRARSNSDSRTKGALRRPLLAQVQVILDTDLSCLLLNLI